jgi:hypothetical protein
MECSKRDVKERLNFVKFWANYVKNTPNEVWSRQQNVLINSVMKSASQDVELYLKVKKQVADAIRI